LTEFIQAATIIIQVQKLSVIVESLHIQLREPNDISENFKSCFETMNSNIKDKIILNFNIKQNMLSSLEEIEIHNQNCQKSGSDLQFFVSPKAASKDNEEHNDLDVSDYSIDKNHDQIFEKHLHKLFNVYHDFDAHSEEYHSHLVNLNSFLIYIIFRSLIGPIKVIIFLKTYTLKELISLIKKLNI
jgi:hypothetical protein